MVTQASDCHKTGHKTKKLQKTKTSLKKKLSKILTN